MIVLSLCNSCFECYLITLMPDDVPLVKQLTTDGKTCKCPRLCGGSINIAGDPTIGDMARKLNKQPMNLTGRQLYQAVNGAGLPDEIPKDILVISALLKSAKVTAVDVEQANGRFYLHEIKLENGVTFHFSGGPRGAQILKMTKEREVPNGSAPTG